MGGLAFASGPDALNTPRMPRQVYLGMKEQCFEKFQEHFEVVESPIEGPGKIDFGDIDILLFGPRTFLSDGSPMLEHLQSIIGGIKVIAEKGEEVSAHFAIPWSQPSISTAEKPHSESSSDTPVERYIQVDVRVCTDLQRLRWILFKHAHGDAWNMIGTTIRPFGLTVDETALWLRVSEIEKADKKRAKVLLTSDPDQVLEFLNLPRDRFWGGPFDSCHDLFEYVAQCRMFWVSPSPPAPLHKQDGIAGSEGISVAEKEDTVSNDKRKLKANDRRRMNLRPAFRSWVEDFIPECRRQGRSPEPRTSRDEVTREAFAAFGPDVEKEFFSRRTEFLLEQDRLHIWTGVIKTTIPQPEDRTDQRMLQYRGTIVKAFKKIILDADDSYGVDRPDDLQNEEGFYDTDKVVAFIREHEAKVGQVAWERQHRAYLDKKERTKGVEAGMN